MIKGAFPLFKFAGIQVYLHFLWFVVAFWEFGQASHRYNSPIWGVAEYLALMGIVLIHEFGHALACRQTGGTADTIMLWPLGGVAFVNPPQRPGAYLWSIVAGPLVNVILYPIFTFVFYSAARSGLRVSNPDAFTFLFALWYMNRLLLLFNILPIYPLDGGQIVRGLLWFLVGRVRSLRIASVLGIAGAIAVAAYAYYRQSIWLGVIAFFIFSQAQIGWQQSKLLQLQEDGAAQPPANTPNA